MKYQISRAEAEKFSRVWTKNGIAIPLTEAALDFATDFGNVILTNFIVMCEQKAAAKKAVPKEINAIN